MQRAVELGVPAAMLREQYRMHPDICAPVSLEVYGGRLVTAAATAARRAVAAPCRFLHVAGWEKHHPGGGYHNAKEAARCRGSSAVASWPASCCWPALTGFKL